MAGIGLNAQALNRTYSHDGLDGKPRVARIYDTQRYGWRTVELIDLGRPEHKAPARKNPRLAIPEWDTE